MGLHIILRKTILKNVEEPQFWMLKQAMMASKHGEDDRLLAVIETAYWAMSQPQQDEFMKSQTVIDFIAFWCPSTNMFVTTLPWTAAPLLSSVGLTDLLKSPDGCIAGELTHRLYAAVSALDSDRNECVSNHGSMVGYSVDAFRDWLNSFIKATEQYPDTEVICG